MMMSDSQLAVRPEVGRAVAHLVSGAHFTHLLLDDKQQRATALEAILDRVVDSNTRVVWVGNPLRSPLTIERFLIQIVGPEVDLRIDRSPAQLVTLMTQPVGDENRLLVIVQQPETMGAEARDTLAAILPHLAGTTVQMQFLFVSSTAFTLMAVAKPAAPIIAVPLHVAVSRKPLFARLYISLPLTLLLGVALGISATFAVSNMYAQLAELAGPSIAPAIAPAAPSAPPATAPAVPAIAPAIAPTTPPAPDLVTLRREFDTFLAKRASIMPPMTEAQKDALFRDFLSQHRRD